MLKSDDIPNAIRHSRHLPPFSTAVFGIKGEDATPGTEIPVTVVNRQRVEFVEQLGHPLGLPQIALFSGVLVQQGQPLNRGKVATSVANPIGAGGAELGFASEARMPWNDGRTSS